MHGLRWYAWLYVLLWMESVICADHGQSVRSRVSVDSNGVVEVRDGVDGMIREETRNMINKRKIGGEKEEDREEMK